MSAAQDPNRTFYRETQRLGARLASPAEAIGLRIEQGLHVVVLADEARSKREAAAVGEGSSAVRSVYEHLAAHA